MPAKKYTGAHFTLRTLADRLTAEKCTLRFIALQRSGRYSELRIVPRQGGKTFRIVGYRWPDRTARRRQGIGRKNPTGATPNQVNFGQHGKTKVGWINRSTPTRYEIVYKEGEHTRTVWRKKNNVTFSKTGRRGKVSNPCPTTTENPKSLAKAVELSRKFHDLEPRRIKNINFKPPKALMHIGRCVRVDYLSDKFDEKYRQYFHEFVKRSDLFVDPEPQANGKMVMFIIGDFEIKPEGITN